MDPRYSGQDVVRCTLCKTVVAPMYCVVCHIDLCKDCVEKHLANKSKVHKVVSLKQFLSTPKCPDHPNKQCEFQCQQCDVSICSQCVNSKKHKHHYGVDIMEYYQNKQTDIRRDLQELEKRIFPRYQKAASTVLLQKAEQRKNSQILKAALNKQAENLHKEIDAIIQSKQSEIDNMETKLLKAIDKEEDAINHAITEIKQIIVDLKSLLDSCDVCLVSKYKSRNEEFSKSPPKLKVSLPNFQPQKINREHLLKQFGSLSSLSIETEEQGYIPPSPGAESSPPDRPLLDVPRIISELATGYRPLYDVSCLRDENIWTSGEDRVMKLYNLQGGLVKSVQTKSGNMPQDTAVTRSGDLLYTDPKDSSINLVRNKQIWPLIILRGWKPRGVCSSVSFDFLVTMNSDDGKQTKVVCYTGSTEKQKIQWDDQGKPLYSSFGDSYLSENRNLDICVADTSAIVVVSAAGKLRFRYTGPLFDIKKSFKPYGITTDSHGRILSADHDNHRIHMLDKDGHFLRFIVSCGLQHPWGLCVDSRDNLFVAEITGKVKKIQYYR